MGLTALDPPVIEEMRWWHDEMQGWSGKSIIPVRSQMVVTTDASSHGWGGWWRQFGQTGSLRNEARGFWLPHEQGMSSNARELSGVLLTVQAALPSLRGKLVLVEGQQGHSGLRESPGWSVSLPQKHRPSTVDNVLQQQHPPLGGAPSRQGQPKGRSVIEMAAGSLGYSPSSRLLSEGARALRSTQCRPLRHKE